MTALYHFVRAVVWLMLLTTVTGALITAGFVLAYDHDDAPGPQDAIVVLGAGLGPDGTLDGHSGPRYAMGRTLFDRGVAPRLVFTGAAVNGPAPASVMAAAARADGVPPDAVVAEVISLSTLQNALFTADLIGTEPAVVLVTHRYHLPRAWVSFRWAGFRDITLHAVDPDGPFVPIRTLFWEGVKWTVNGARASGASLLSGVGVPEDSYIRWLD